MEGSEYFMDDPKDSVSGGSPYEGALVTDLYVYVPEARRKPG